MLHPRRGLIRALDGRKVRMLVIRTQRLILRDFQYDDFQAYGKLRSTLHFQRFYPEEDASLEKVEQLLGMFITWANEQPRQRFQLAVTLPSDKIIGSCGVRVTSESEHQGSFGCELGQAYWGMGYAYEAGRAMIEYGFREMGLHRIYAETIAENEMARRLAQKLGMREEGILRENRWFKDRWWSTVVLSLLESEWMLMPSNNSLNPTPR